MSLHLIRWRYSHILVASSEIGSNGNSLLKRECRAALVEVWIRSDQVPKVRNWMKLRLCSFSFSFRKKKVKLYPLISNSWLKWQSVEKSLKCDQSKASTNFNLNKVRKKQPLTFYLREEALIHCCKFEALKYSSKVTETFFSQSGSIYVSLS